MVKIEAEGNTYQEALNKLGAPTLPDIGIEFFNDWFEDEMGTFCRVMIRGGWVEFTSADAAIEFVANEMRQREARNAARLAKRNQSA